jgi:hypothetical protein
MTLSDGNQHGPPSPPDKARPSSRLPRHDVFVSYSTADKPVADAIVSRLEQASIRCWIAPRDVIPGMVWAEAIIEAIDTSRLMVVVLSGAANQSNQVVREVERAIAHNVVVIPFRIESILPTGAMAYYLGSEHWLDALTPPLESHIANLVKASLALLERPVTTAPPTATEAPPGPSLQGGLRRAITRPVGLVSIGLAAIALIVAAVFVLSGMGKSKPAATASPSSPAGSATAAASGPPSGAPSSVPSGTAALNWRLDPSYGNVELTGGFTPDPYAADLESGGEIDVSYLGEGCVGFASEAPDFDVMYTPDGAELLRLYFVAASSDTTMVVNAPDGSWYCSDDADGSIDPMVDLATPEEGLYDIWIGGAASGELDEGTLYVTGLASNHP